MCSLRHPGCPGRSLPAQDATNAELFPLFGWGNGIGTKLAHKLKFFHFISRANNFKALKTGYSNSESESEEKQSQCHQQSMLTSEQFPNF